MPGRPDTDHRPDPAPFAGLTPDVVLDALAAVGFEGDGRLTQLNSFENRVFQVMLEDGGAVVTKFYRPGRWSDEQIAEEHAFSREAQDADVPVVAPLPLRAPAPATDDVLPSEAAPGTLACITRPDGRWRFAVWPRRAGRAAELEDPEVMQRLGTCLGRLHNVGAARPFRERRRQQPLADARQALDELTTAGALPTDQQGTWSAASDGALAAIDRLCRGHEPRLLRIHGDCHPGNLLWRDGPNLVDLDDSLTGPAVQDLWMLLSGEPQAAALQLQWLLDGYERVRPFDRRELGWIEALRLARMIRHNAWVALRWQDPAFPVAYPDFGSSAYWAQQCTQLREQTAAAHEAAENGGSG